MRIRTRSLVRASLAIVACVSVTILVPSAATAQSSTITQWMLDHNTVSQPNPYPYITVEEGDDFCEESNGLGRLETTTVATLAAGKAVVSELPIDAHCSYTISQDEGFVSSLVSYVEAHGPAYTQKWFGVMLDEESAYGITAANLESLNAWMHTKMSGVTGVATVYSEIFRGENDWGTGQAGQNVYNAVISGTQPAPQVSTSYMVTYVNAANSAPNLVTWSYQYAPPYNNQAASVNPINGIAYYACPYATGNMCAFLSNEFTKA